MRKRLGIALAAGMLAAAMLPGMASAAGKGPPVTTFGDCAKLGIRPHDEFIGFDVGPGVLFADGTVKGPAQNNDSSPFTGTILCGI
jgi:hypothetical protein